MGSNMDEHTSQDFWSRVEQGHAAALVGQGGRLPPSPRGWWVVRVRCDGPQRPLGPVDEARSRIERLVGDEAAPGERASRLARGIRRHLLGELPGSSALDRASGLARDLDRLADPVGGPSAILFEGVDGADLASLELLGSLVRRADRIRPALVFGFRGADGPAAALLAAVREVEGDGRVLDLSASASPAPRPELSAVPFEVRQVLRAAAVVGDAFEIELVGHLLDLAPRVVLERLQAAADAGVPVEDLGGGRLRLDEGWSAALTASLLPSLAASWHEQLALLLAPPEEPRLDAVPQDIHLADPPEPEPLEQERAPVAISESAPDPEPDPFDALSREGEVAEPAPAPVAPPVVEEPAEPEGDPFSALGPVAPRVETPAPRAHRSIPEGALSWGALVPDDDPPPAPARESAREPLPSAEAPVARPAPRVTREAPLQDPSRAARHLLAAGQADEAARRYLEAAREAVASGALPQAEAEVRRALALLERLPDTETRRITRALAHGELARVHWEGAGGAQWTLPVAGREADDAFKLVEKSTSPAGVAARAEIRALRAGIAVDVGDPASLERALGDLVAATRERSAVGDARGAASLLNDQAAVWVRIGDPVRAAHLLRESQAVFQRGGSPEDSAELAATLHLMARLPLTVAARPGLEARAIEQALEHAAEAAETYATLGDARALAAVLETNARLEMRRGGQGRAREQLGRALEIQLQVGDVLGLARTTASLAEALAASGRVEDGLRLLVDSIHMNASKGSLSGIAWNRKALETLVAALPDEARVGLRPKLAAIVAELESAEARLGAAGGGAR